MAAELTKYDDNEVKLRLYTGWENGEGVPSPENLKKIVAVLGLTQDEEEMLYHAAARVPPKIRHLPFSPNPFFTGRKSYLKQLRQFLQENGTLALTQPVSISGLGGIGKTQLALAYAYLSYSKVYRVVLWLNATNETTLQSDYDTLARKLGLPEEHEREPEQRVRAVKQWLDDHTHWLLIMDNADNLELARSYFPECNHGHILLTTRSQFARKIGARALEIDKMEPEDGLVFLLRRTDKIKGDANPDTVTADIREHARQLVELLDGHPLALDQAGAYIEETGVSFTEYINLYDKQRHLFLDTYGALDSEHSEHREYNQHPETVVMTFKLCFNKARERSRLASDILHFCAFLQPDAIPEELFQHDDSFTLDALAFNKGIAALQRYSLIKRNTQERTLSMHRLVQAVVVDALPPDLSMQWIERVMQAVNASYPGPEFSNSDLFGRLVLNEIACATWAIEQTSMLRIADIAYSVSTRLLQRGLFPAAETLLTRALSIYEQHIGDDHPNIATSLASVRDCLVVAYLKQDKSWEAEQLILRLLVLQGKYLGINDHELGKSLCQLAFVYTEQGKYEQAMLLYQQVTTMWQKHLGAQHPDLAIPIFGFGLVLFMLERDEQAETMLRGALSIRELRLGANHPLTQETKKVYESLLDRMRREAEAAAREANDEPPV